MKFKVHEVTRIRADRKDEYVVEYLFADYADAVAKFKELIAEEKKVDWIEEVLENIDNHEFEYQLEEGIDEWYFSVEHGLDTWHSEVMIIEREVF